MSKPAIRHPTLLDVIALHQEIMTRYGQTSVLRDNGEAILESAMMRPQMAAHYEGTDLARQAALLILGVAQAHPFADGNKRLGFAAGIVFLQLNGYLVKSRPRKFGERVVTAITSEGRSGVAVDALADCIRSSLVTLTDESG